MSSADVDEYVKTKLPPQHEATVRRLRELVAEVAPDVEEVITYGSPAWKGNKMLAIVSPTKTHVTLAFDHGVDFDDPHGLLEGVGKRSRHVKLKTVDDIDEAALRDYFTQAVAIDSA